MISRHLFCFGIGTGHDTTRGARGKGRDRVTAWLVPHPPYTTPRYIVRLRSRPQYIYMSTHKFLTQKSIPPSQNGYGCFYFGIKRWCYPENNNKKNVKDIPTFKWARLDELPIGEERCNIPSYCEKREWGKDVNR